jgi:hypothetical protein
MLYENLKKKKILGRALFISLLFYSDMFSYTLCGFYILEAMQAVFCMDLH